MKYTIFLAVILFSCSKDASRPDQQPSANGSIQYKVNGQLVVMDNIDLLTGQYAIFYKKILNNYTWYQLNAQKGVNTVIEFNIPSDSLHETNYHYDSTSKLALPIISSLNGQGSMLFFSGDYFDLNITSYKNGRASGSFTGKFSSESPLLDYNLRGTTNITEGIINNVQVVY